MQIPDWQVDCFAINSPGRFKRPGDASWNEVQYPLHTGFLKKCDAVLRLQGASKGADEDVRVATKMGLKVHYNVEDVRMKRY